MGTSPQDASGDQPQGRRAGRVPPRVQADHRQPTPEEIAHRQAQTSDDPADGFDDATDDDRTDDESAERFGQVVGALNRLIDAVVQTPRPGVQQIIGDPLSWLVTGAERLGVGWPAGSVEMTDFIRARLAGGPGSSGQLGAGADPVRTGDRSGFDPEFTDAVLLPPLRRLAGSWFRVEVQGRENIPEGGCLLVANHAGALPLDALVLQSIVFDTTGRHLRTLGADLIFEDARLGGLARTIGVVPAHRENAEQLLSQDQLLSVFPEGFKGLGKPYAQRYRLQRFGRGGFVSVAVRSQVPLVPVSIVGSEEIYPQIGRLPGLARKIGLPYLPVTPLFPLLGVAGMVPLPSKWVIRIGEPIATDRVPPGSADDPAVVFGVTGQVRETIQDTLDQLLTERGGVFGD